MMFRVRSLPSIYKGLDHSGPFDKNFTYVYIRTREVERATIFFSVYSKQFVIINHKMLERKNNDR